MMDRKIDAPSIPHLVHIETTYACNQYCRFCYNPNRNSKIEPAVIDQIVARIHNAVIPHVYLIGGEPSLLGTEKLNEYIELLTEHSSVTIVTNGQEYLDGLSTKLACIGVPLHGLEGTHDYLTNKIGSFKQAISSIEKYVARGFDVRCIPVLTAHNFDQMYDMVRIAKEMGMESVFVDRYEDGGLGSKQSDQMKPTHEQFGIALGQMIQGRDDFGMPVGWGTAIPFCLDSRLISERMTADCGAGITFAAINPNGDVRSCNQSERVYGNILNQDFETIWSNPDLEEFRGLSWVTKPCTACDILTDCLCGCKVDANSAQTYSVDYSVRGNDATTSVVHASDQTTDEPEFPAQMRLFRVNSYTRLNLVHKENYLVTRYQTIEIDALSLRMLEQIIGGVNSEQALIELNREDIDVDEIRGFVSILAQVDAIDVEGT